MIDSILMLYQKINGKIIFIQARGVSFCALLMSKLFG